MAGALNVFKTVTANLTTTSTSVYSTPLGYATVVLLAQISNITGNIITVTAQLNQGGNVTSLIEGAALPPNDAINALTGRLIMNYGDQFKVNASANASAQLTLSILETLTG